MLKSSIIHRSTDHTSGFTTARQTRDPHPQNLERSAWLLPLALVFDVVTEPLIVGRYLDGGRHRSKPPGNEMNLCVLLIFLTRLQMHARTVELLAACLHAHARSRFCGFQGNWSLLSGCWGFGLSLDSAISTPISHLAFSLSSSGLAEAPGGTAAQESVVLA